MYNINLLQIYKYNNNYKKEPWKYKRNKNVEK